jgi:hypothetical protein
MLGYWMLPRITHLYVVYFCKCSKEPLKSDWLEWYQNYNLYNETRRSWYHLIDKKHIQVYVKFESRLFITFRRKMRYKKNGTFSKGPRGQGLSSFQKAGFEMFSSGTLQCKLLTPFFCRVAYFSEPTWTTHRQISQTLPYGAYLLTDTQKQALLRCMLSWTLKEVSRKRWIGVVSKEAIYSRRPAFFLVSVDR